MSYRRGLRCPGRHAVVWMLLESVTSEANVNGHLLRWFRLGTPAAEGASTRARERQQGARQTIPAESGPGTRLGAVKLVDVSHPQGVVASRRWRSRAKRLLTWWPGCLRAHPADGGALLGVGGRRSGELTPGRFAAVLVRPGNPPHSRPRSARSPRGAGRGDLGVPHPARANSSTTDVRPPGSRARAAGGHFFFEC
jgi:hypothetical protein